MQFVCITVCYWDNSQTDDVTDEISSCSQITFQYLALERTA